MCPPDKCCACTSLTHLLPLNYFVQTTHTVALGDMSLYPLPHEHTHTLWFILTPFNIYLLPQILTAAPNVG